MAITGFFKAPAKQDNKQGTEYSFISVGGEQFHALAVAFIDSFKNSTRVDEPSLKKVLERFFSYYPKFISTQPYLTPADRMTMLINNSRKSEIVECMAYVLRQLTVDEVLDNPLNYREVFKGLNPETSRDYLRQPNTVLPSRALTALTQVLAMTITLSFTEHGKELRRREIHNNSIFNSSKFDVTLQVQGNQYFPKVKNKTDFAYVGQLAVSSPKPVDVLSNQISDIADILDQIATDNHRLKMSYEQSRKTLLSMISAGELTRENLIALFIEFLPQSNASLTSKAQFFSELEHLERQPVVAEQSGGSEQQETKLLADTLAGWISAGQVDENQFFERAEGKTASVLAR